MIEQKFLQSFIKYKTHQDFNILFF